MSSLGNSDDFFFFFFCVTASSPMSVADFLFTYFCNPPVHPSNVVPCHSAPLRAVHSAHLPLLDMNSRRFWRTSPPGTFRHQDTAYHRSHSPCDSHLNRHVLAATPLVWPLTLAHHLVHLSNTIRRTCLLLSTLLLNTEASSNQLLLFTDWVVLRTLVVAWKSRHTRVLHFAACTSPCCTLKHPLVGLLHVLLPSTPRLLGLCHPAVHGPESSWDCRRVLHKTPPNELDRHDPSARGLHSSRCARLNREVQHRPRVASTESARTKSNVISQAMHDVSLLRNCSIKSNSAVSLLTWSSILELSQELRLLLTCCEQASKLRSAVSHSEHG